MKQHIEVEQLNDLSNKGKQLLRDWWKPQAGDRCWLAGVSARVLGEADSFIHESGVKYYPLLSIGQMLQFLDKNGFQVLHDILGDESGTEYNPDLFCDQLWEAVKKVLEQ
jgi:hypothetical protein